MLLSELFTVEHIATELTSRTKSEIFQEMAEMLTNGQAGKDSNAVVDALFQRESVMNTQIAPHVALPHASLWNFGRTVGALGISRRGVDYGSQDGKPVHVVLMLLDDRYDADQHLSVIKSAGRFASSPNFVGQMLSCENASDVHALILQFEQYSKK